MLDANLVAYQALADDYRVTSPKRLGHAARWLPNSLLEPIPGERALDIGCADGSHAFLLAEFGYDVTAVDFSPRMIGHARTRAEQGTGSRPAFLEGEFLTGKFRDDVGDLVTLAPDFHLVVANAFVHLFPSPVDAEVVGTALGLVAPGGAALFSTTVEDSRTEDFLGKSLMDGTVVERWRGRYPRTDFVDLISGVAGDGFEISHLPSTDMRDKPWVTVVARRRADRRG
ncbi:class I SAM-dependent methyltransferase [Promicromonospora sp. NPDC059942]|uniref:class I SAM-dependent methyltransferase n=1 Tax=Promicromonospora sp. NPDC059942 TaxID=3347009 RepID=UPI003647011A